MDTLQSRFESTLEQLCPGSLPDALFGTAPFALRFEIGGHEEIYLGDHRKPNGAYVENAVDRAMQIYAQLPGAPDILGISGCPGLSVPGLPKPDQKAGDFLYWSIGEEPVFLRRLFREIIKAEIDPNGMDALVSSVFFLDSRNAVLFHLYDDRGALVAAAEKNILQPLYETCSDWIAEWNRGSIR